MSNKFKHIGLFEGIGGFSLAARWAGWETVAWCEWNEFGQKVLRHHFPEAEGFGDITKTNFKKYANTIDVLTGGFPCQPFSTAGKRKGTNDERYLWHEMLRAINEIKPKFVIAENVYGITNIDGGLVFEQVCLDLEANGYEVQPYIIPACAKNAPHRRDRCWFIAQNPLFSRCLHGESNEEGAEVREFGDTCTGSADRVHLSKGTATDTASNGQYDKSTEKNNSIGKNNQQSRSQRVSTIERFGNEWTATNTESGRTGGLRNKEEKTGTRKSNVIFRSKHTISNWEQFPTQSPICTGDDGLSSRLDGITFSKWRNESIKAGGNAIVPQVAYEIFKVINQMNENHNF